jgi:8-oxo-dGTP diphosphatase
MVYFKKPKDFIPQFKAVSCYLINSGKILLLKRQLNKTQGGKWGTPAGKIESGESPEEAVIREVFEETGIKVLKDHLSKQVKSYVVEDDKSFLWSMFIAEVNTNNVSLKKDEHTDFIWILPEKALTRKLALDEDLCIKKIFNLL